MDVLTIVHHLIVALVFYESYPLCSKASVLGYWVSTLWCAQKWIKWAVL